MKSTFIKLNRNILHWRWYQDGNTFRVFVHFLLTANIKPTMFRDIYIDRGELLSSYDCVANTLKLSKQEVRTAFRHLKATGEITVRRYSKFSIISVVNYELYQAHQHKAQHNSQHSANTEPTVCEHHIKNIKNVKELKEKYALLGIDNETLSDALIKYEDMRLSKQKGFTDDARKRFIEKLFGICSDAKKQIRLVNAATDNYWMSVFDDGSKETHSESKRYKDFVETLIKQNEDGE